MQDNQMHTIENSQITASSYNNYSNNNYRYAPWQGRLRNMNRYWATLEADPKDPWIQVDFINTDYVVTGIQTQGSARQQDNEWVEELQIQTGYSEESLTFITEENEIQVSTANSTLFTMAVIN